MKLLTKEILEKLPPLRSTEHSSPEEIPIVVKLFHPASRWTLYVTEYSPEERLFWGYCKSALGPDCDELGYTSLDELESSRPLGLSVERDMYFGKHTLKEVMSTAAVL